MKIEIDQVSIKSVQDSLGELAKSYKPVMVTSINKTLGTAKTQAAARIGAELNLTATRIKQDITIEKANYSKISGAVIAKGEPVGLAEFSPVDGPTGITVKVLRSSPKTLLKHAFLAPGKSSSNANGQKLHVFWRQDRSKTTGKVPTGEKSHLPWKMFGDKYRIPLERLTGPRIEDIFGHSRIFDPVNIQAQHVYLLNVEAKIAEIIRRSIG